MSNQTSRIQIFMITILVATIVIGAVALSAAALMENLRFARSTSQTYWLVGAVRQLATQQKNFAQNPGDDLWAGLTGAGQVPSTISRANPWGTDIKAVTVGGNNGSTGSTAIRIENTLPSAACRHMGFYFLSQKASDLGLSGIELQPSPTMAWMPLNMTQSAAAAANSLVPYGCGLGTDARLALTFKIR